MTQIAISVVIPVLNESINLESLVKRTLLTMKGLDRPFEIVLIDDGSTDGSQALIEEAAEANEEVIGIILNRNYGQHAAIMAGFTHCRGEMVITLDADLQNPPEEIPRLVEKIDEGFDVVGTIRTPREDSMFRRTASGLVNRIVRNATGVAMQDYGCMLRAYHRNVVKAMVSCPEKTTFIPVLANSFARRVTEIEVGHARREEGKSNYSFLKLITLQFDLLTSMTTFPIRALSLLGLAMAGMGVLFGLFLLLGRIFMGGHWAVNGVFTLFAVLFLFMGGQFFGLGLLGEYVGRIFTQVRGRPNFYIHHITGETATDHCDEQCSNTVTKV